MGQNIAQVPNQIAGPGQKNCLNRLAAVFTIPVKHSLVRSPPHGRLHILLTLKTIHCPQGYIFQSVRGEFLYVAHFCYLLGQL